MQTLRYALLITAVFSTASSCGAGRGMSVSAGKGGSAGSFTSATRPTPSLSVPDRMRLAHALSVCALTTGGLAVPNCLNATSTVTNPTSGITGTIAPAPSSSPHIYTQVSETRMDHKYIDSEGRQNLVEYGKGGRIIHIAGQPNYTERRRRDR